MNRKRDDKQEHGNDEDRHDLKNYLDTVIQTSHDGIFVVDSEGRFEFGNEAFFRILGWPEKELLGHHFIKVIPSDLHEFILERWEEVQAGNGEPYEVDILQKDSTRRSLFVSHRHMTIAGQRKYCVITKDVTERKNAKMALESMGQRFRLALQSSNVGIWDWNLVTNEVYFSPEWKAQLGYAEHELSSTYEEWEGRLHPEDRKQTLRALRAYHKGQADQYAVEFRLQHKDGSYRWIFARGEMLLNDSGEPVRMTGCHLDITDRIQAEDALKQNHSLMRTVLEGISDPIFLKDRESRYILLNTATARGLGRSSVDEVVGTDDTAHLPVELALKLQDKDRQVMMSGESEDLLEAIDVAGSTRFYRTTKSTYHDDEGNVLGVIGIARDITDRKQAEDALREKSMRESLILQSLPMAFYVGQPFGDYGGTWVSDQINQICGFTAEQFCTDIDLWASRLHPDDRERTLATFDSLLENDAIEVEYRWQAADGKYLWFLDQAVLVRDENGNPKDMIGTWLDITERKQAEEELMRYHTLLEEMVQMRTSELTDAEATLRMVHRRLLNVSEAERRHLASELHDSVGQKLVAMALAIQQTVMVREDSTGHEAEVQALQNVGQQCTETIREIRTICYGLYPPMLELTGLAPALRQLGQSCEPAFSFHFQCDDSLEEARFDPEQEIALFRMAQEAVSNVLKHSEAMNISISLTKQANVLTMSICDDGVGFDTTSQLGQGLGLRSMTERARAVDGTIEITSQPDRTNVEVTLPVKPPRTPE
ncbi:MAG: PAS domain S-box protein [Phycisphaerae bacterium]|jgi:PAS domain S-box-containing protein|nr:PAS domain S-box protein [Phycisphaerae bacterium]